VRFSVTQDFPAGLGRLWATLGRADYVRQKYLALGSTSLRVLKFEADEARIEVELERGAPVAAGLLPPWARLLARRRQGMHHWSRWQRLGPGQAEVELVLTPRGLHTVARGLGRLQEVAPACTRLTLDLDVRCSLPVRAAGVAGLFARQLQSALEADHAFTLEYLARRGAPRAPR
jgi:hypothetical protein